jgi:hypothetical protein
MRGLIAHFELLPIIDESFKEYSLRYFKFISACFCHSKLEDSLSLHMHFLITNLSILYAYAPFFQRNLKIPSTYSLEHGKHACLIIHVAGEGFQNDDFDFPSAPKLRLSRF